MVYASGGDLDVYDGRGKPVREAKVDKDFYKYHDTVQGKILIAKDAPQATIEKILKSYFSSEKNSD